MVHKENAFNSNDIKLVLNAERQKVGLAEASIRSIREKAKAAKAVVR
jgi:hypothetical protein